MRQRFVIRVYDRRFFVVVEGLYLFIVVGRKYAECGSTECDNADNSGSKRLQTRVVTDSRLAWGIEYEVKDSRFRYPITCYCEC